MDLDAYRRKDIEQERVRSLLELIPSNDVRSVLDVGARDGYLSTRIAERGSRVVALDLETPMIQHPGVECIKGNAVALEFPDGAFDVVLCAEVLEHIPHGMLERACSEIERVSRGYILIGVPYQQDTRVGRTTCQNCGKKNPPWGHVNTFDEARLQQLFAHSRVQEMRFVGRVSAGTNRLSALLTDWGGNPYGTYEQDEPCIHCGAKLVPPSTSTALQRNLTRMAFWLRRLQQPFVRSHANWVHVLFVKGRS